MTEIKSSRKTYSIFVIYTYKKKYLFFYSVLTGK